VRMEQRMVYRMGHGKLSTSSGMLHSSLAVFENQDIGSLIAGWRTARWLDGSSRTQASRSQYHNIERNPSHYCITKETASLLEATSFKRYDRCKRPIAVASPKRIYLDERGRVVHEENMVQNMTNWHLAY